MNQSLTKQVPMEVKDAYNSWSVQYDTNLNKTRDLEAESIRSVLSAYSFSNCLEIGCGTGKNTEWLITKAAHVVAIDLSEGMLAKAREKISSSNVQFYQADITGEWPFDKAAFDLVTFSLVLEHINNLSDVLRKVYDALKPGGIVYIGELHPFKQYSGSKARFETEDGNTQVVECFTHHISDFIQAAKANGLQLVDINELFDDNDRSSIPRILTIVLQKPA